MDQQEYGLRLHGIDIVEKILLKAEIKEVDEFNFGIKLQSAIEDVRKLVIIVVEVGVSKLTDPKIIAKFTIACGFEIQDFETTFKQDEGTLIVPPDLENLLKSIGLSTMRGIMYSELRGTALHKAILPIIDLKSLQPVDDNLIQRIKES